MATARLARVTDLAVRIARAETGSPLRSHRRLVTSDAQLTSTGMAIVVLAAAGEAPSVVVKLPMNRAAALRLARETAVLTAISADRRLGRWRDVIPRPHVAGTYGGQRYRIDSALPGATGTGLLAAPGAGHGVLRSATESIAVLHETTARSVTGDPDLAHHWVDVHVRELLSHIDRDRRLRLALERIGAELEGVIIGGTFSASRIHGDYWPGNLLFASPNGGPRAVAGIVDWDASAGRELPLHDLLHLLFYTRRLLAGRELGEVVQEHLVSGEWSAEEHVLLAGHPLWSGDGSLSGHHALLLYWLRHAAMHTRQQIAQAGWRYRLWQRRNVLPVLEWMWASG
jgi:hypothetical protein